ncbi:MAG: copper transporter [Bacillota bacterium]
MIIDIRYHIITLVAVFLMLGVGILIGTTMVGNETLVKQQRQLADRLEERLNGLRMETLEVQERCDQLEAENNTLRLFAQNIVPFTVAGRLNGVRVAVFEVGGPAPDELLNDLKAAGGIVEPVVTVMNELDVKEHQSRIAQDFGWSGTKPEELTAQLAREIGRAVATGRNPAFIDYLAREGLINATGSYNSPVKAAVVIGGVEGTQTKRIRAVDLNIIDGLVSEGVLVAGVEESTGNGVSIKEYQKWKISTVDNIDTPWGRVALVLSLSGYPGNYGTKETAKEMLPPYPAGGTE